MAEPTDGEFDLNTLNDEELVEQVHDDLYNGLKPEVEQATRIFLKRGWYAGGKLHDALADGMRIVSGDIHDIVKNLVSMMLEGAGFEVIDLVIINPVDKGLAALEQHKPNILGM